MTCTRPDLFYVVSQHLSKPVKSLAKQVLRYLKGTYDRCLQFVKGPQLKLVGYSDSDWAMSDDRRSTINQSFILTCYAKELKNSFNIQTCINITERIFLKFKIKVR